MRIIGLDLSSTRTGICDAGTCSTIDPPKKGTLLERARHTADHLRPALLGADLVTVEQIPPSAKSARTLIALATVHALVFDRLAGKIGPTITMVGQSQVKKYATGKGNADKEAVLIAALRHDAPVANNDEADAWWLWTIGEHLTGNAVVELTAYRRAVVEALVAA